MSQQELLTSVSAALDSMGIDYMVTGSVASSFYGEPRLSHDIDVLLHVTAEMVREESMFNLVDTDSGDKVDFWILTSSPYDRKRFRRRVRVNAFGAAVWVSSSEDVILSKLSWSLKAGGSEKQFRDALRVRYGWFSWRYAVPLRKVRMASAVSSGASSCGKCPVVSSTKE